MIEQEKPTNILIPQFSIRFLLKLTAGCAVVFSIFAMAMPGAPWAAGVKQCATGVSLGIVSLAVLLLVYGSLFGLVWMFSLVTRRRGRKSVGRGRSPFSPVPADDKDNAAAPIILE